MVHAYFLFAYFLKQNRKWDPLRCIFSVHWKKLIIIHFVKANTLVQLSVVLAHTLQRHGLRIPKQTSHWLLSKAQVEMLGLFRGILPYLVDETISPPDDLSSQC